jgi:predicted NBD/HSP70 family sugar kinase
MNNNGRTGNNRKAGETNILQVLNTILRYGPISRTEIATRLGIARSTVSVIVGKLLDAQLVTELGEKMSGRPGRNQTMLGLDPASSRRIAAVDVQLGEMTMTLCRLNGELAAISVEPFGHAAPAEAAELIQAGLSRLLEQEGLTWDDVVGVGVSFPGIVQHARSAVSSIQIGWFEPVNFQVELAERLPCPVFVENDVKAATVAEWVNRNYPLDMFFLYGGIGIGGAFISSGKVYGGRNSMAGRVGHISVNPFGETCRCGRKGCLELYASIPALLASVQGSIAYNLPRSYYSSSLVNLKRLLDGGDPKAVEATNKAVESLASALHCVVYLLDCSLIVIGGPITFLDNYLLEPLKEVLQDPRNDIAVNVEFSKFDEDGKIIGAAHLVNEILLNEGRNIEDESLQRYFLESDFSPLERYGIV